MPALRNRKHEIFAQHVAAGVPLVEALELAGFRTRLASNGRRLRNSEHVKARIDELWVEAAKLCGVAIGRTLIELSRLAYSRLPDLFEKDGDGVRIKDVTVLPPDLAAAVREMKIGKDGTVTIKMHDKVGALSELRRHLVDVQPKPKSTGDGDDADDGVPADQVAHWSELPATGDRPN